MWAGIAVTREESDEEMPCEPAGHGEIATGSVSSCASFWRTFVRSPVVMQWIEHGYRLLWGMPEDLLRKRARGAEEATEAACEARQLFPPGL